MQIDQLCFLFGSLKLIYHVAASYFLPGALPDTIKLFGFENVLLPLYDYAPELYSQHCPLLLLGF